MQLHSIFSFLGKSPMSSDSDVDASAGTSQSTGFGAMLSSTLERLAPKGDHAAEAGSAAADRQAVAGEIAESDLKVQTDDQNESDGESIRGADAGSDSGDASTLVDDSEESLADGAQNEVLNSSTRSGGDVDFRDRRRTSNSSSRTAESNGNPSEKARADVASEEDSEADAASSGRQDGHATSSAHSDAGGSGRAHSKVSGASNAHSKAGAVDLAHAAAGSAGNGDPAASAAGDGGADTHRMHPDSSTANPANLAGDGAKVLRGRTGAATAAAADDARGSAPSYNQRPPVNTDADTETAAHGSSARRPSSPAGATGDQQSGISSASQSADRVDGTLGATEKPIPAFARNTLRTETRASVNATVSNAHDESAPANGGSSPGEPFGKQLATDKNEHISGLSNGRLTATSIEGHTTSARLDGRVSSDPEEKPAAATQRSFVNGSSPDEPLRTAELERSASRFSADRVRITVEPPNIGSSSHATGEAQASRLDRSALEARIAAELDHAAGAGSDRHSGSTTRAATASANTASANTASTNTASANTASTNTASPNAASLGGLPAADAVVVEPTKLTGAEEIKGSSVDTAELDTQSRAAAMPSGADDRAGRDARADGDRADSRAASTDRAGSGDATNTGADQQSDFASGTDPAPDDAFDVAAAERSGDTVGFESLLHEDVPTDVEPPIDIQFSESTDEMTFSPDKARSAGPTSHVAEAQRPSQPRQGGIVNWVRARLEDGLKAISIDEGWKVLEMKLDEGQGTMTIRARRDEEKVSITVNFTDPQLRALAAENADRLQESLRSQYQADVDFSLMSDNPGQSQHQSNGGPQGGSRPADPAFVSSQSISGADRARAARAAHSGARNEWIG